MLVVITKLIAHHKAARLHVVLQETVLLSAASEVLVIVKQLSAKENG